jgi:hypothetical protein
MPNAAMNAIPYHRFFRLEFTLAVLLMLPIFGAESRGAPPQTTRGPTIARAARTGVIVRSGPGLKYPAADELRSGDTVEVYHRDAHGWLAIRPPEESFSWVNESEVRSLPNRLAEATREGVPVYVGGSLLRERRVIQVRLRQNEVVEVLRDTDASPGGRRWLKIAPPRGEFRWVHEDDVTRDGPGGPLPPVASRPDNDPAPVPPVNDDTPADEVHSPATEHSDSVPTDVPERAARDSASDWADRAGRQIESSDSKFDDELAARNIELSKMLLQPPGAWRVDDLEAQVDTLARRVATARQLRQARELLDRLASLREIQNGMAALPTDPTLAAARTVPGTPQGPAPVDPVAEVFGYDGFGRLTPVISRQPDSPPYALTDSVGEILYFVTPGPGVNLRRFEGQQVGIKGMRGYMEKLDRRHLTAQSVTPVQPTKLR